MGSWLGPSVDVVRILSGEPDGNNKGASYFLYPVFSFIIFQTLTETTADVWQMGIKTVDQLTADKCPQQYVKRRNRLPDSNTVPPAELTETRESVY